jgi:D-alanine-D-alanine ligase
MDIRLDRNGHPYILEANPNPNIAWDDEYASAAKAAGIPYEKLIQRVINIGIADARHRGVEIE